MWVFLLFIVLQAHADKYRDLPPELINYDVQHHIHIHNDNEADSVRKCIIDFLWDSNAVPYDKMPEAMIVYDENNTELPSHLKVLSEQNIEKVEFIDVMVDYDYHHYSYFILPKKRSNRKRLVIVHQGHQGGLLDGIATVSNRLLENGYSMLISQMPI